MQQCCHVLSRKGCCLYVLHIPVLYDMTHTHTPPFHATKFQPLLTGKSRNSLGVLNAAQKSRFKRQRLDGFYKNHEKLMRNPKLASREKRWLPRGRNRRESKLRRDFNKRGSYLGNRIFDLTTRIDTNEQHIRRIDSALSEQKLEELLAPLPSPPVEDDEGGGDSASSEDQEGEQKEKVSLTQENRLWYQGYSVLEVLRQERLRDMEQLGLMQAAKAVSDESLPTEAAVNSRVENSRQDVSTATLVGSVSRV